MDRYSFQGHALVIGLFLAWTLIIGFVHWTGDGFAMDGDQDEVIVAERN